MSDIPAIIWSNTDYPYICLIDKKRTETFRRAIQGTVKPGDIVLEVGAGTGILSLFAAEAGAAKVYAVEIDPVLAKALHETVQANNLEDKIKIIQGDALEVDIPEPVNVVIGELIETGLLDEMQVAVMNGLHQRGIIGPETKLIPQSYQTSLQLVHTDSEFFGFHIAAPKHDWPYYSLDSNEWAQLEIKPVSDVQKIGRYDFQAGPVEPVVNEVVEFTIPDGRQANAFRLSGKAQLSDSVQLGATNSFSGDKILHIGETWEGKVKVRVSYTMGAGLHNFSAEPIS